MTTHTIELELAEMNLGFIAGYFLGIIRAPIKGCSDLQRIAQINLDKILPMLPEDAKKALKKYDKMLLDSPLEFLDEYDETHKAGLELAKNKYR
jgi:hypothetical protein